MPQRNDSTPLAADRNAYRSGHQPAIGWLREHIMLIALSFIRANWRIFAIAGAVLALLGAVWAWNAHERGIGRAQAQKADAVVIAAVRADLKTCRTNTATLEATLGRQNAAVQALKAESDARVAQSVKAVSGARAVAESYRQSAASILRAKAGVDRCQSADQLVLEAVR